MVDDGWLELKKIQTVLMNTAQMRMAGYAESETVRSTVALRCSTMNWNRNPYPNVHYFRFSFWSVQHKHHY